MTTTFDYRTIFISDVHLGFRGCRAEELAAFLKRVKCERVFLIGDIVDMWMLRQRWSWPSTHNQVIRRLLKLARHGTSIIYVPGNHDDALRSYSGLDLGGIRIARQAIHTLADGKRVLVTHGDEYDLVIQNSRLLALFGAWAYDHLVALNRFVNNVRSLFGLGRWSFSRIIKKRVKSACTFVSRFEEALTAQAHRRASRPARHSASPNPHVLSDLRDADTARGRLVPTRALCSRSRWARWECDRERRATARACRRGR